MRFTDSWVTFCPVFSGMLKAMIHCINVQKKKKKKCKSEPHWLMLNLAMLFLRDVLKLPGGWYLSGFTFLQFLEQVTTQIIL